jgi:hypothetical protein
MDIGDGVGLGIGGPLLWFIYQNAPVLLDIAGRQSLGPLGQIAVQLKGNCIISHKGQLVNASGAIRSLSALCHPQSGLSDLAGHAQAVDP